MHRHVFRRHRSHAGASEQRLVHVCIVLWYTCIVIMGRMARDGALALATRHARARVPIVSKHSLMHWHSGWYMYVPFYGIKHVSLVRGEGQVPAQWSRQRDIHRNVLQSSLIASWCTGTAVGTCMYHFMVRMYRYSGKGGYCWRIGTGSRTYYCQSSPIASRCTCTAFHRHLYNLWYIRILIRGQGLLPAHYVPVKEHAPA